MTSPGGPARASGPASEAAGTDRPDQDAASPGPGSAGEGLHPVPDPPAHPASDPAGPASDPVDPGDPGVASDDGSTAAPADGTPPAPGRGGTPAPAAGAAASAGDEGAWPGQGPDTGTVRRSRPSRSPRAGAGVPTPPSPMNVTTGPTAGAPAGPSPVAVPDPPRRPVPPTFPSPGQPPPGVARRHGRHARPERPGAVHTPPAGYRPRHAAPDAETEQFAAAPATGPGGLGPAPLDGSGDGTPSGVGEADEVAAHGAATTADTPTAAAGGTLLHTGPGIVVPPTSEDAESTSDRVRVVLAERRVPTRAVRTVAEIEQQTATGELLLRNLLRAQLALGLRLGLVAVFVLGALPVLFGVLPRVASIEVAGVTLPWLVLGLAPYPFMLALAWLYTRTAERNELDFADNVED